MADASSAITKALLGEREAIKMLGISILDADVKAKVLENTQQGLTFETERQAKAFATLQLAQEQSKNAIGDFERSQDSFANQSRIAQGAIEDLKAAMGEGLLPIATASVSIFGQLAGKLADFIAERNKLKNIRESDSSDLDENDRLLKYQMLIDEARTKIENMNASKSMSAGLGSDVIASIDSEIEKQKNLISSLEQKMQATKDLMEMEATYSNNATKAAEEAARIEEEKVAAAEAEEERQAKAVENAAIEEEIRNARLEKLTEEALYEKELRAERWAAEDAELEHQKEISAEKIAIREAELAATASIFGSLSSIFSNFSDDNRNAAIAEKAFASAQAAINSYLAFTQVLASTTVPTLAKPVVAAATLASGLAQQASILSTPIPGFAEGGIVPGTSYSGDNVPARVNSGEMVLTKGQQAQLFDMANGSSSGSQSINVYIGTKKIATEMVSAINAGQGGTISSRVIK